MTKVNFKPNSIRDLALYIKRTPQTIHKKRRNHIKEFELLMIGWNEKCTKVEDK